MAETFADLGLKPELVEAARAAGYVAPSPIQRSAVPVLRRGGNAVLYGSPGAGVVGAYGLGLLDRLAGVETGRLRALVVVGSDAAAVRIALSLARLARPVGVSVAAAAPGWAPGAPDVVVASAETALREVEASRLKLDALEAFVLDSAAAVLALSGRDVVEALTVSVPREAQRVVVTAEATQEVESYVERHVRRALWIPGRPGVSEEAPAARGALRYAVAPEGAKAELLAELVASGAVRLPALLHCRTPASAAAASAALELRGFRAGASEPGPDGGAAVFRLAARSEAPTAGGAATAVSYDVPFDAASLGERHAAGGVVLVLARELPHLRQIAADAQFALEAVGIEPAAARSELDAYRARIRRAVREEDVSAQLLVLEPLLTEFSAAEVAAALSALLRQRAPAPAPAPAAAPAGPAPRPWVRLFVSAGQRDSVRPGDLVGAITGEAGITGEEVGRIEIRDTFSIVEVAAEAAERVIQALNGVTLKGRSLRVDYDRKPAQAPRRGRGPGG